MHGPFTHSVENRLAYGADRPYIEADFSRAGRPMQFICDFHIHSHYSIATSRQLDPEHLETWARMKGIRVVGTGDFTHPGWAEELEAKLEPEGNGLFRLKPALRQRPSFTVPDQPVSFVLTAEISNIYKRDDRVRKVHNVVFAPDFAVAGKIRDALDRIGNITSDGRPILGLDSRDLLEIVLEASDRTLFVPAHIWTPWFSALGAKSGFDTIEACYADLADHIHVVETGLSSDPPMNWLCSFLDRYTLISNSDAHSPEKLGREANRFDTDLSWDAIRTALVAADPDRFLGTLEFFPQEGKYHYDGHRKCGIRWHPLQTSANDGMCPVCGKKITVGVMHRVMQLADRNAPEEKSIRAPFTPIIPLKEMLSEIFGVGVQSKRVNHAYHSLIGRLGPEFAVLLDLPLESIGQAGGEMLAEAVRRMRKREVSVEEGYDGEYGRITVFTPEERKGTTAQHTLFETTSAPVRKVSTTGPEIAHAGVKIAKSSVKSEEPEANGSGNDKDLLDTLDEDQRRAANHGPGPAIVLAGPGSGKTRVLTSRIVHLLRTGLAEPENCLAVTFTNKAADEMRERLSLHLTSGLAAEVPVMTFHAFGHMLLKAFDDRMGRPHRTLIDAEDREWIFSHVLSVSSTLRKGLSRTVAEAKLTPDLSDTDDPELSKIADAYESYLTEHSLIDLDDLIAQPIHLLREEPEFSEEISKCYRWVLVDEFQDVSPAQYAMLRSIMPKADSNLFIIGDPDQAIYGFRGADRRALARFQSDYPDARHYRLPRSYRCTDRILQTSRSVLHLSGRPDPPSLKGLHEGVKCRLSSCRSDRAEAEFVARTIETLIGGVRFYSIDSAVSEGEVQEDVSGLGDFAVLCRIHRQFPAIEKAFLDHAISYQTVGTAPFFKEEPVRTVIDLLRLAGTPGNAHLYHRIASRKHIRSFTRGSEKIALLRRLSVKDAVGRIINDWLVHDEPIQDERLQRLLNISAAYGGDFETFLDRSLLGTTADTFQPSAERVALMTLHSAKGLEFTVVFIVGCEDGLLPYTLHGSPSVLEEEKHLLYVGMTRARRHLFISHAEHRMLFGRIHRFRRSPFLDAIAESLIEHVRSEPKSKRRRTDRQFDLFRPSTRM